MLHGKIESILDEAPFLTKLGDLTQGRLADDDAIDPQTWDSVDVLDLIAAIDESYGVTLPLERLNACRTVGELRQLIRSAAETA
ncbi:MAG: acyl carrier protein [Acidobacteriota bacterium]|nr:acyl carrier protein [Acidobacteriota bacterium]